MDVRTFEAQKMKDVIATVKRELGHDAVILSTKERVNPNANGMKTYEVTAARAVDSKKLSGASTGATSMQSNTVTPDWAMHLENSLKHDFKSAFQKIPHKNSSVLLESGVREIKNILVEMIRDGQAKFLQNIPTYLEDISLSLRGMNLDESVISEMMRHLKNLPTPEELQKSNLTLDYYRSEAIRWCMKRIKIAPKWSIHAGSAGATAVHILLGAGGVGKSSTAAKIISHYALKEKISTLIIHYDGDRIASGEQLKVYARIIGVPFISVTNLAEIPAIVAAKKDVDLIIIDTQGRNPKVGESLDDFESLKSMRTPCEFHLVLSATERQEHMEKNIKFYSDIGLHSLIFTKLDESWIYGDIFNASNKWSIPLSFFSTGKNIPEDFERATKDRVIERLFGIS